MFGTYDMTIARQIWRNKIAKNRKALFEQNDLVLRDAVISGDQTAIDAAVARRDELRAIGDSIDAATTIEELKAIVPE